MSGLNLKKTVRAAGKEHTVPITYVQEGSYHVVAAPRYDVEVRHLDRIEAFRRLETELVAAIERFAKTRL
jgi:translation initiation factor 2 alpha subunit (eIF-2alpha)